MRLYTALRVTVCAPRDEIAAEAGVTPEVAADGWRHLEDLSLVQATGDGRTVTAVAPEHALTDVVARHRALLDRHASTVAQLSRAADILTGTYRRLVAAESAGASVEIINGSQDQRLQLIVSMNARTRDTSDSMHPGPLPPAEVMESSLREDTLLLRRGVKVRALYGQSALGAARNRKYLSDLAEAGVEVRIAPEVPFDLVLSDRDVAYLRVAHSPSQADMVEVRGDVLLASYQTLYDHCWTHAAPFTVGGDRVETGAARIDVQDTIVRLMVNGLSDDQICRKQGISPRTLRRHTAEIMERLGATSRFQAGVLAARSGVG